MSSAPTQPETRPASKQLDHPLHVALDSAEAASPQPQSQPESQLPFSTPDLVQLLAALDFDPIALAAHLGHQLLDILAWYESPEVQDIITRYEAFEDRMLELRAKRSKRTAIDTLETVIKSAEDLPERRRAATTLLRALTRPAPRPKRNTEKSDAEALLDDAIRAASRAVRNPCHQRSSVDASVHQRPNDSLREPLSESDHAFSEPGSASDHGNDTHDVDPNENATSARRAPSAEPGSVSDHGTSKAHGRSSHVDALHSDMLSAAPETTESLMPHQAAPDPHLRL